MPPHLRGNNPVNQRKREAPLALYLCRCRECRQQEIVNPRTGAIERGNRVSKKQYDAHHRRDGALDSAQERLAQMQHVHSEYSTQASQPFATPSPLLSPLATSNLDLPSVPSVEPASDPSGKTKPKITKKASGSDVGGFPSVPSAEPVSGASRTMSRTTKSKSSKSASTSGSDNDVGSFKSFIASIRHHLDAYTVDSIQKTIQLQPLVFTSPPIKSHGPLTEEDALELKSDAVANYAILTHEAWLSQTWNTLDAHLGRNKNDDPRRDRSQAKCLMNDITSVMEKLLAIKKEEWQRQFDALPEENQPIIDTSPFFSSRTILMEPITCICYILAASLRLLANASMTDCAFLLTSLAVVVGTALKDSSNVERSKIPPSIPSDVRTVIDSLAVEPHMDAFVCCPGCFYTYKIVPDDPTSYPEFCTYQRTPKSKQCRTRLQIFKRNGPRPVRRFLYQNLHHWISRMYCRPDIEEYLDTYPTKPSNKDEMKDIWDGSMLREFCGPDMKPFLKGPENEGRLVFGLNLDGFGPYSKKKGGKGATIDGIYLVCFNLPPEIRYKTENICLVGLVPGPKAPSLDQINHVLRPVVDDFLVLWWNGIHISKTAKHPLGRPVRAALLPLICDLPAARQASGHGSYSATRFCSECDLLRMDINNLDTDSWRPRNVCDHRKHANLWKNAKSSAEQERIFGTYGVRWSELLRLPYWDPTKHTVIEQMHAFYLRILFRHIRDIWGMDVTFPDGNGISGPVYKSEPDAQNIADALNIFHNGGRLELEQLTSDSLKYLCYSAGLQYSGRRNKLIDFLVQYKTEHRRVAGSERHVSPQIPSITSTSPSSSNAAVSPASRPRNPSLTASTPGPSSNLSPPLSAGHTKTAGATSAAGLTPLTTKDDMDPIYQEYMYEHGKNSAIKLLRKAVVVAMCVNRFKGKESEYTQLLKPALADKFIAERDKEKASRTQRSDPPESTSGLNDISSRDENSPVADPMSSTRIHSPNADIDIEYATHMYQHGTKSAIDALRKGDLVNICVVRFVKSKDEYKTLKKPQLLEIIHAQRDTDKLGKRSTDGGLGPVIDERTDITKPSNTKVLGEATLKAIREDMAKLSLPSHISPAPKHPGEVSWGNFKAAEWKTFCTINLPITLTRLWGCKPEGSRYRKMLANYMDLVAAIKISNSRTMTEAKIRLYEKHMRAYLHGLLELYPYTEISPYQHLSLHYGDQLRRFGPTHSWRCFAFERYNGIIQNIPTNERLGELEETMALHFCRAQNLRVLFSEQHLPPEAHPIIVNFEKHYKINIQPSILQHGSSNPATSEKIQHATGISKEGRILIQDFGALRKLISDIELVEGWRAPNLVRQVQIAERSGHRFQPTSDNEKNAHVIFRSAPGAPESAGVIQSLFTHKRWTASQDEVTQTFAIVQGYEELANEHIQYDLYRTFPVSGGHLRYNRLSPKRILIPFTNVITHAGCTPLRIDGIDQDLLHVLPLE